MSHRYKPFYIKKDPIVKHSYGIACCRYNLVAKRMEILMVKKRYTFYFLEFIMGHYSPNDDVRLLYLFNRMSIDEKIVAESMDFDRMWYHIWREVPTIESDSYPWFCRCRRKFTLNFVAVSLDTSRLAGDLRLKQLLSQSTSQDCMWEIPKGKRNPNETELECAIRETAEETGVASSQYRLIGEHIEMQYSNEKVSYANKYFVAIDCTSNISNQYKINRPRVDFAHARQISEIVDVRWISLEEIKFLDLTHRFSTLIGNCFKMLRSRYRIPKLTELALI